MHRAMSQVPAITSATVTTYTTTAFVSGNIPSVFAIADGRLTPIQLISTVWNRYTPSAALESNFTTRSARSGIERSQRSADCASRNNAIACMTHSGDVMPT